MCGDKAFTTGVLYWCYVGGVPVDVKSLSWHRFMSIVSLLFTAFMCSALLLPGPRVFMPSRSRSFVRSLVTERYTHDVVALAAFGFDADSLNATEDRPCVSFQAMHNIIAAMMKLMLDPIAK